MENLTLILTVVTVIAVLAFTVALRRIYYEKTDLESQINQSNISKNELSVKINEQINALTRQKELIENYSLLESSCNIKIKGQDEEIITLKLQSKGFIRLLSCLDELNVIKTPIKHLILAQLIQYDLTDEYEKEINTYLKRKKSNFKLVNKELTSTI